MRLLDHYDIELLIMTAKQWVLVLLVESFDVVWGVSAEQRNQQVQGS